jgi:hypothetical protein
MPLTKASPDVVENILAHGFVLVRGGDFHLADLEEDWRRLTDDWNHLETDKYMTDGGCYRLRRYGRFFYLPASDELLRLPHATVFQSTYVNNFAGGIHRDFAPLRETTFVNPFLHRLIRHDFSCFTVADPAMLSDPWEVWIHQIRIETDGKIVALPAPEGIHHDGHDFIAMHMVKRDNVAGGGSVLYDNSEQPMFSCMLESPLDTIYADDHRVMHSVAPISTLEEERPAKRDILIIDFDHKPGLLRPS